jgi:hypothetical protein
VSLPAVHELRELVRQLGDLTVHRAHVAAIRTRQLTLRVLHTAPQVSFPKSKGSDFDRLCDVHFAFELRR